MFQGKCVCFWGVAWDGVKLVILCSRPLRGWAQPRGGAKLAVVGSRDPGGNVHKKPKK